MTDYKELEAVYRQNLEEDQIVVIRGKLDLAEEGSPKLLADSVLPLEQATDALRIMERREAMKVALIP